MLKLLPKTEVQDNKAKETALAILRTQELQKAEKEARLNLARAEADFNATLAKNQEKWAEEEEKHLQTLKEIDTEVENLKIERQVLLQPIEQIKKEAEDKLAEAFEYLASLKPREEEIEVLKEKLEDRLDEIGAKEQDLIHREQTVVNQEKNIALQTEQITTGGQRLALETATFIKEKQTVEKDIDKRKTEVRLVEISLDAFKQKLDTREKGLNSFADRLQKVKEEIAVERKELMRPVEDIVAEAEKFREQTKIELASAQKERDEAKEIKLKAQDDYTHLLTSLDEREAKIKEKELNLNKLQAEYQRQIDKLNQDKVKLEEDQKLVQGAKEDLARSVKQFQDEKGQKELELKGGFDELEKREKEFSKALSEAQSIRETAFVLNVKTEQIKEEIVQKKKDTLKRITELNRAIKQNQETKEEAEKTLAKLKEERQNFSIWRTDAEKYLEKKAIENTSKHTLLSRKEEQLKRQEKFLADWATKLKDERGTLDRAWNELKQRNIPPK